jgi:L-alanine-DL-glutamate epimerase-like enolase superfamily enzyme
MYEATLPFGRKGIAIMALSGVDLALWDLRAKAAERPLWRMLTQLVEPKGTPSAGSGSVRRDGDAGRQESIRTYTTVWDVVDPATAASPQAVKLHVHPDVTLRANRRVFVDAVVARVAAARHAIGPHRELMVDAWMEWDLDATREIAARIAPQGISWIEEPLPVDDLAAYDVLAAECPIPIAGGEHEFTAHGFRDLIARRVHHVLQPDACWVGGMTELVKIYRMAAEAGLRVVPHRGAEVWGLHAIAGLHPASSETSRGAALTAAGVRQHPPLAESGRPWMTWVDGQPPIVEGTVCLPARAGFGVTIADKWFE